MDITFTTRNGGDPVEAFKLFIENIFPNQGDVLKAGDWLAGKRRQATLSGQDVTGAEFAPYSPAYAFKIGTSKVTLYSRNSKGEHMLDALEARPESEAGNATVEVGIFGNEELATRARLQNEGGITRTQRGKGNGGFRTPLGVGRRQTKGKDFATIPARNWLGASNEDLIQMQDIMVESAQRRQKESLGNG